MNDKTLTHKLFTILAAVLLLAALLLTGCAKTEDPAQEAEAEAAAVAEETAADPYAGVTGFLFSDDGISVSEGADAGYEIEGTALTITGSGAYRLSGSCADGTVTVKKGTVGVTLILDGLDLTSADSAPICCNKSTEVTIVAAAGSVNRLADTELNNDDEHPDNENAENAVIKTKDGSQVTLSGSGTIDVYAYGKNGVKGGASTDEDGEASLTVEELTLNIYAYVNDGLKSDQELNILSGTLTVEAADDGVKSDLVLNIGAAGAAGPVIRVNKSYEGIEGATINIYSGDIRVIAEEDGVNAANSELSGYSYSLNIYGGSLYVDAATGDGLDSNGTLTISDGVVLVFSASAGSDNSALDGETGFTLSGGTVLGLGSSMMAELPSTVDQAYVVFGSSRGGMGGPGGMPGMGGDSGSAVSVAAGAILTITDADGNIVYEATALRDADYLFFSCDGLNEGETYALSVNGETVATAAASLEAGMGGMGGPGGFPGGQPGAMPGAPGQ